MSQWIRNCTYPISLCAALIMISQALFKDLIIPVVEKYMNNKNHQDVGRVRCIKIKDHHQGDSC